MLRTELRPTVVKAQHEIYAEIESEEPSILKGLLAGAVAGLTASYVMNVFQSLATNMLEPRKPDAPNHEQGAQKQKVQPEAQRRGTRRPVEPATVVAGRKLSRILLHHRLRNDQKEFAGQFMHYAMGVGSAMIYGAAAEAADIVTVGEGVAFGTAVWVFGDEITVPLLRLSKPPLKYSLNVHAKSLAAHFVYGFVTEILRKRIRSFLG